MKLLRKPNTKQITNQPKISAELPITPLTENECAQLAGGGIGYVHKETT